METALHSPLSQSLTPSLFLTLLSFCKQLAIWVIRCSWPCGLIGWEGSDSWPLLLVWACARHQGNGSVHAPLDDRWLRSKTSFTCKNELLLNVGIGKYNKWLETFTKWLYEDSVCETEQEKYRGLIAVYVSRKHLLWLVTQQLCKLNATQFVPPLALYYAIISFSNEKTMKPSLFLYSL